MAIKLNGEFDVKKTREEVYDFLTDPQKFGPLLPDFQGMTVQDPTHFTVKVKVGVSYIKGSAEVKMQLAEADRPSRAKYTGQGSVGGGSTNIAAGFDLTDGGDGGTKVRWSGEAQVFGKLASVAGGLLEPLGKKNVQKLIDGLRAALQQAPQQGIVQQQPAKQEAAQQESAPQKPPQEFQA
jgi:carbon monoxide dehydrogenase subunit G